MMQHFSVTNRIRHILKQSADINRVLNEIKKYHVFKDTEDITKEYYRTNKLITEKKKDYKQNKPWPGLLKNK